MRKIMCVLVLAIALPCCPQAPLPMLAGAYSNTAHAFANYENAALLIGDSVFRLGFYGEKKYMIPQLGDYSAAFTSPIFNGTVGLGGRYKGSSYYHETTLRLSYGQRLSQHLALGAAFNWFSTGMAAPYGKFQAVYAGVGLVLQLNPSIRAGISINNPFEKKYGRDKQELLPAYFNCSLAWLPSGKMALTIQYKKNGVAAPEFLSALQYQPVKKLLLSFGMNTTVSSCWLSVGFLWDAFRVDLSSCYQSGLGLTPSSFIQYQWRK